MSASPGSSRIASLPIVTPPPTKIEFQLVIAFF